MKRTRIANIVKTSMMTVMIILCAWITIPAPVPFTMQTFGIYMAVMLIGSKATFTSVILYILLGLAGLPVFSGFATGAGYIVGPTGGYLLGFLLCPLLCLIGEKAFPKKNLNIVFLTAGTILCYITGTVWFMFATNQTGNFARLWGALTLCVLPYIIPDAIKLIAAYGISKKLKPKLCKLNKD